MCALRIHKPFSDAVKNHSLNTFLDYSSFIVDVDEDERMDYDTYLDIYGYTDDIYYEYLNIIDRRGYISYITFINKAYYTVEKSVIDRLHEYNRR